MTRIAFTKTPQVSWERVDGVAASQTFCTEPGTYQVLLKLNKPSTTTVEVYLRPRGTARAGIDYLMRNRVVRFSPGMTERIISVHVVDQPNFTKPRTLDLIATPFIRFENGKVRRGKYTVWRFNIALETEPPLVTIVGESSFGLDAFENKTITYRLSQVSNEDTNLTIDFAGTDIIKGVNFLVDGETWNDQTNSLIIPAGELTAAIDLHFLGSGGRVVGSLVVPDDNTRRNMMTFSSYGVPETGIVPGTEAGHDSNSGLRDDAGGFFAQPTDWLFGCDNNGAEGQWSLIRTESDVIVNPDGTPAAHYATNDNDGGAGAFGCIRKSYGMGTAGGYDFGGTVVPELSGGFIMDPPSDAPIREGYNIWSAYVNNQVAPSGLVRSDYTEIELLNNGVQAGISDDPNPASHKIELQWSAAGIPTVSTASNVDSYGIESVGDNWFRVWIIYDAPAEANNDTANWFVRPCSHPSEGVADHYREGCFVWGAQFEYDATRTASGPSEYQAVETFTWYAGEALAGDSVSFDVLLTNPDDGSQGPPGVGEADPLLYVGDSGILPARQPLPAQADLLLTPTAVTIMSDVFTGYGPIGTVYTIQPNEPWLSRVVEMAEDFWRAKNGGQEAFLGSVGGRLGLGELVRIDVSGNIPTGPAYEFSYVGFTGDAYWSTKYIRDLAFVGVNGPGVDYVGALQLQPGGDEVESYVANWRYENVTVKNSRFTLSPFIAGNMGDLTDRFNGALRFYDCQFEGNIEDGGYGGTVPNGLKWGVKGSGRACWDIRNCDFDACEEHCAYVDSVQGFLYFVDNTTDVLGNGRTMAQHVDRYGEPGDTDNNPGPGGYGVIMYARNVATNMNTNTVNGGADFTVVGFDGDVYILDNQSIGDVPASVIPSATRGCISVWTDSTGIHNNHEHYDAQGNQYVTKRVIMKGHLVDFPGGARGVFKFTGCNEIEIYPFTVLESPSGWPQITFNDWGAGNAFELQNTYGNVQFVGLLPTPASFAGWGPDGPKVRHGFANGTSAELTDTQINVYDGSEPV